MGRAIEARIWTGKKMLYLESTAESHNHYLHLGSEFYVYNSDGKLVASSITGGEIMLKTPKLDKNRQTVWEGDIVKNCFLGDDGKEETAYFPVVWSDELGAYGVDDSFKKDGSSFFPLMEFSDIELAGNIYQNKDLIQDEQNID